MTIDININDSAILIRSVAIEKLKEQMADGSFPAGHNGPHGDIETPVRNTSHWLYTLCWLINMGENEFRENAERAADYLISTDSRPMNASFYCRYNPDKNCCNGLVGQAWVMEALVKAATTLKRQVYLDVVEEVFNKHKWSANLSAWHILNVDGSNGAVCSTFNQQLWFASIACQINKEEPLARAEAYLNNVLPNIELYDDGVIYHDSPAYHRSLTTKGNIKKSIKALYCYKKTRSRKKEQRARSVGYHGFNLVPLITMKKAFPNNPFWASEKFTSLSFACNRPSFLDECTDNKFAFPYNPVGFELAYFFESINGDQKKTNELINKQIQYLQLTPEINIIDTKDNETSLARLYEACRIGSFRFERN